MKRIALNLRPSYDRRLKGVKVTTRYFDSVADAKAAARRFVASPSWASATVSVDYKTIASF